MTGPITRCLADAVRYPRGYVTMRCRGCKHESTVTTEQMVRLVGRDGAQAPWKRMQQRLRCRSCRAKNAEAMFWQAL